MNIFRLPSISRKRRDSLKQPGLPGSTTGKQRTLRSRSSLPNLAELNQPFFITEEDFDLARLKLDAKAYHQQKQSQYTAHRRQEEDKVQKGDFTRPTSATSRRSSTISNTTTGPTPEFFTHQKTRRSLSSTQSNQSFYTLTSEEIQEMNKLRKEKKDRSVVDEWNESHQAENDSKEVMKYHLLQPIEIDSQPISAFEVNQFRSSKSTSFLPNSGYNVSTDFRTSPSADTLSQNTNPVRYPIRQTHSHSIVPNTQPASSPVSAHSDGTVGRKSILDRPRKSMIFQRSLSSQTGGIERESGAADSPTLPESSTRKGLVVKGRKGRDVLPLNMVVVGSKGVGKTSFANLLLTAHKHEKLEQLVPRLSLQEEEALQPDTSMGEELSPPHETLGRYPNLPFHISPVGTRSLRSRTTVLTADDPSSSPTVRRASRHMNKISQSLHPLTVIDTPGLSSDPDYREIGIRGLEKLIEGRMRTKLNDERRVQRSTRRGAGEDDGLIYLVFYLINPASVLTKPQLDDLTAPSWDFELDRDPDREAGSENENWEPSLRSEDIRAITRLSRRTTVLPIIARSDTLTKRQFITLRRAVWDGLSKHDLVRSMKAFRFLLGGKPESDRVGQQAESDDSGSESDMASDIKNDILSEEMSSALPAFVFCPNNDTTPEEEVQKRIRSSPRIGFKREYLWAELDALDSTLSDFSRMYGMLFDKGFNEAMVERTQGQLYEEYRTEQLTSPGRAGPPKAGYF